MVMLRRWGMTVELGKGWEHSFAELTKVHSVSSPCEPVVVQVQSLKI
jgi:hypothetical protein